MPRTRFLSSEMTFDQYKDYESKYADDPGSADRLVIDGVAFQDEYFDESSILHQERPKPAVDPEWEKQKEKILNELKLINERLKNGRK